MLMTHGIFISQPLADACHGTRVHIEHLPLDLFATAAECDLAIGHGTHGFTAAVLLAGKPQLLLPLVLEQRLTSQRVAGLGAGCLADVRNSRDIILKIRSLWNSEPTRAAAHGVGQRYRNQAMPGIEGAIRLLLPRRYDDRNSPESVTADVETTFRCRGDVVS